MGMSEEGGMVRVDSSCVGGVEVSFDWEEGGRIGKARYLEFTSSGFDDGFAGLDFSAVAIV